MKRGHKVFFFFKNIGKERVNKHALTLQSLLITEIAVFPQLQLFQLFLFNVFINFLIINVPITSIQALKNLPIEFRRYTENIISDNGALAREVSRKRVSRRVSKRS